MEGQAANQNLNKKADMEEIKKTSIHWLDKPVFKAFPDFSVEKLLVTLIILITVFSRFVMLGDRVMSHDEVNHVVPSYNLYAGSGYSHDPITHGPFQFHMLALSYFLLGDNDFSSRVPAALFSIAAVVFILFAYKRYLGRIGALLGGFFFMVSPFILFYGRYTRNEAFIELFAVLTFYAFFRYYERRDNVSLYILAVVTAFQFVTKETAFIYTAQLLLFCGFLFLYELWLLLAIDKTQRGRIYSLGIIAAALLLCGAGLVMLNESRTLLSTPTAQLLYIAGALCAIGAGVFIYAIFLTLKVLTWKDLRRSPAFNLVVFIGALILPQLTAFPVKLIGWNPLDYSQTGMLHTGIVLLVLLAVSFVLGCWWNRAVFLRSAAAFYVIFILFYTTVFSNGQGFFTGIVGSLGYWLSQQEVARGGQPWYYYWMILVPVYEFAALAGSIMACYFAARHGKFWTIPGEWLSNVTLIDNNVTVDDADNAVVDLDTEETEEIATETPKTDNLDHLNNGKVPVVLFLLYWVLLAILAYSAAGEKMPWLTVHIAVPLALAAAWGFAYLLETMPWRLTISSNGLIGTVALITGAVALFQLIDMLCQPVLPFSGKDLEQLRVTSRFVLTLIVFAIVTLVLMRVWRNWPRKSVLKTVALYIMALLVILQTRTAFTASFINFDSARELLVYAHAAPGPKIALHQIEEIAARTGVGKSIKVAYDNDALYPYWWYFRDYDGKYYFGEDNPTRSLRNYDVIIANTSKEGRLEPIVRDAYYKYQYMRLWWPNQDYWFLTPQRVWGALTNPQMLRALFNIWLNRDYKYYGTVTGKTTFTPETWDPSTGMVMYMKKDLLLKTWQLGNAEILSSVESEDFSEDEKFVALQPVLRIGEQGSADGQFESPRNVAVSSNGTVYVLDSGNNRVQVFESDGTFREVWDGAAGVALSQPWGISIGTDDNVFIADTWNHRILKFSPAGKLLLSWYATDKGADPTSFYGPRSIAVSSDGSVYISDTGNKRVMVYDENGNYQTQFGVGGTALYEFDEPVGIALRSNSEILIADTWNQRVQILPVGVNSSTAASSFDVSAWYTQSLDNKPYIAALPNGDIVITDPESYLVVQYTADGTLVRSWNGGGGGIDDPSMPTGIFVDSDGAIWVADALGHRVNKFVLPQE